MTTLPDQRTPSVRFLVQNPAHAIALGFGSGLAKKAPGTVGTLLGIPFFYSIMTITLPTQCVLIFVLFCMGIYVCDITGKHLGVADHGSIVWDEIVAMMLVLAFSPPVWWWWLLAFALFRLFDIWKPFPIRECDAKLKGGFGVMFDDLLAALYTIFCLQGLRWIMSAHLG